MNKKELIEKMYKKADADSKAETKRILDAFIDTVESTLKKGDKVSISGFGTFQAKKRKARTGVNPQTGEKMQIPAVRVAKFKAGSGLKRAVRK